jgi:hypothetical protein
MPEGYRGSSNAKLVPSDEMAPDIFGALLGEIGFWAASYLPSLLLRIGKT